jgi:endonuclease-3
MVRLGVFPAKTSAEKMIAALSENIPHELHYSLHLNLIELGRAICTARKTNCNECPIQKYCGNSPA